ncbi:Gfo/Idh/MocA family protein [Amycolatopsis albispora]|uniref:Oxidoreductase n=1 Tax=Amycolatopsis albispora TaxID=1804986 RepID=A0A344LBH7_9PSEU|nr:Gfo/Idh/MocA family oxidoreductase [Amycolatopsis albispora]AXB45401.1 oxidoreductase [Amycolatopsis albispora]
MNLRWGLLAAGRIAAEFADGVRLSRHGELAAVAARDASRAAAFARRFDIPRHYGDYQALLDDPEVDVVYISTPHTAHAHWAIRAAEAGKHVLCEKPLTINHAQAVEVIEAAKRHDVFLMEAYMYRPHPQTRRLVELIESGALGEVRAVDVSFGYRAPDSAPERLGTWSLGGGGILDIGGYGISMARLVARAATGSDEPEAVTGLATIDPELGVDTNAVAALRFPGGILAQISCATGVTRADYVRVYGTEAHLLITRPPWAHGMRDPGVSTIELTPGGTIEVRADQHLFAAEADYVAEHVEARQAPEMSWSDTLANMRTLDRWRAAVGLSYEADNA